MPSSWNFSRFLANVIALEETLGMVTGMIATLREQLMEALPDFGRHLGYDGKAIVSHSTGRVDRTTGETSDSDADWGQHETVGVDARTGKLWKQIKTWFGYGVHLIADTQYEIPVAMHLTPASHAEQMELRAMLKETFAETPELAARCRDCSAETKALLWEDYRIRPLIDTRGSIAKAANVATKPAGSHPGMTGASCVSRWTTMIGASSYVLSWMPRQPDFARAREETPARRACLAPAPSRCVREKRRSANVSAWSRLDRLSGLG